MFGGAFRATWWAENPGPKGFPPRGDLIDDVTVRGEEAAIDIAMACAREKMTHSFF